METKEKETKGKADFKTAKINNIEIIETIIKSIGSKTIKLNLEDKKELLSKQIKESNLKFNKSKVNSFQTVYQEAIKKYKSGHIRKETLAQIYAFCYSSIAYHLSVKNNTVVFIDEQ